MKNTSAIPLLIFILIFGAGVGLAYSGLATSDGPAALGLTLGSFVVAVVVASATKIANQWERTIVLRLGRFVAMKGPGLFFIIPVVDTVPYWIDIRVITTSFKAEKTLTKDTVPVDVDA
ncbi:MAG: slipin family protein, partial [Alphaproteobacteria bacterium]|nr:slipin family protein [Alphaproteobacteria bacterium]